MSDGTLSHIASPSQLTGWLVHYVNCETMSLDAKVNSLNERATICFDYIFS